MAIITEHYMVGEREFVRTYSDRGMLIHGGFPEADYDEGNDPIEYGRTYVETDIPIGSDESAEEIVDILTGVSE